MTNTVLSADGGRVGERGRKTRLLILGCLVVEIGATGYRGTTVARVARRAKKSRATFYQYFPDVDHALLALAEEIAQAGAASAAWTKAASDPAASHRPTVTDRVQAFFTLYEQHRVILRVIEMKSAEGDRRFTELRMRFLDGLHTDLVRAARADHPAAGARTIASAVAPLVLMLAEVAAHENELEPWSLSAEAARKKAAELAHTSVASMAA